MLKTLNQATEEYSLELNSSKSGLIPSDHINGFSGFIKNRINVVGARPFVGVTNFLLSIANELSLKGEKTLFISTHQPENEILKRLVALTKGIDVTEVRDSLEVDKIVSNDNLFIYEAGIDELSRITYVVDQMVVDHQIQNVIIDSTKIDMYLLEEFLHVHDVTIFLGQRLGKSVDKNADGRPRYKDFLKSKINMKPVSVGIGLYRPEFYGIVEDEQGDSTEGVAEIVVLKSPIEEVDSVYRINQNANFKLKGF